jgi:thioredoxin 1
MYIVLNEEKIIKGKVFLLFSASWCNPCKQIKPFIKEIVEEFKELNVYEVEVDSDDKKELVEYYKITSVPTLVLLEDGNKIDEVIGTDLEKIKNLFSK